MNWTRVLQNHILALVKEHGIVINQRRNLSGMMFVEEEPPRIEIPTLQACPIAPTVNLCYMVGLHEIGHCVLGHTQGRPPFEDKRYYFDHGVLRCEAEAWNFALDVSKVDLTHMERNFIADRWIGSYILGARHAVGSPSRLQNGNRHHVLFTYDDPDNPYVQNTVNRIRGES